MACCSIIIGCPIDWWSFSAKYWGPGPRSLQRWCPWYSTLNVATEHRHARSTAITILYTTIYQWLSAVSGIVFQSLTVASIRGHRLKLLLRIFAWQKFRQLSSTTSQRMEHAQNFGRMSFGGPLLTGALRTCVPCLMVNPAMTTDRQDAHTQKR